VNFSGSFASSTVFPYFLDVCFNQNINSCVENSNLMFIYIPSTWNTITQAPDPPIRQRLSAVSPGRIWRRFGCWWIGHGSGCGPGHFGPRAGGAQPGHPRATGDARGGARPGLLGAGRRPAARTAALKNYWDFFLASRFIIFLKFVFPVLHIAIIIMLVLLQSFFVVWNIFYNNIYGRFETYLHAGLYLTPIIFVLDLSIYLRNWLIDSLFPVGVFPKLDRGWKFSIVRCVFWHVFPFLYSLTSAKCLGDKRRAHVYYIIHIIIYDIWIFIISINLLENVFRLEHTYIFNMKIWQLNVGVYGISYCKVHYRLSIILLKFTHLYAKIQYIYRNFRKCVNFFVS